VGCSTTEPGDSEPAKIENLQVETVDPEPVEPEPANRIVIESESVEPAADMRNDLNVKSATSFHDKCAVIFKNYVDERGMVDYKTLRRKRLELKALVRQFNKLDPKEYKSWTKEDKIAFWINVYNLNKLDVVTDNYPITPATRFHVLYYWGSSSIRHIESQIARHKFLVMDEEFTFAEIERRFFRKEFDDPRIFFAITGACVSSPPLRNEPYFGSKLDEQLEDQAKKFISNPIAFRIDRENGKVYLSAIFQISSYGGEFVKKYAIDKKFKDQSTATRAVLNFISNYISRQDVSYLEVGNYTVKFMSYDWTINDY
jgi:hypothetical protein